MKTDQEKFWQGEFGEGYINRNKSDQLLSANIHFFSKVLERTHEVKNILELGCNIGMNLRALQCIKSDLDLTGVDINQGAIDEVNKWAGAKGICGSILEIDFETQYHLTFTKGVLIHINPDMLNSVYDSLYKASKKYILVAEYYNPTPVSIEYHGEKDKLFKRDFAGDMLARFNDLKLIDYGFLYRHDPNFPQDDISWFLMEKV
ncbi:hypothetical protein NBRC116188_17050 [Oceaniserpentilla sp. 4NH20-0058]|uniref:pseudaminic acid biosynthesis-associated methylase n=1 Tax=Oceaniserpentilla sp. 4NH20-0058 TaxID=3127660 RepID=UPI0031093182